MKRVQRRIRTVPTILQFEAVECGAACLAMILASYGKWVTIESLRLACGVSRDGAKASNILKAARTHGLAAKGFKKEPADLVDLHWPLILHWNFEHFVIFEGWDAQGAWINDPAVGRRRVDREEFDRAFTGVALAFEKTPEFTRGGRRPGVLPLLAHSLQGVGGAFVLIFLLALGLVLTGVLLPVVTRLFVDGFMIDRQTGWIAPLLGGLALAALVRVSLNALQQSILLRLNARLAVFQAVRFVRHVLQLPIGFFTQRHPGEIADRVSAGDEVARLLSDELATTAVRMIEVIFYGVLLLLLDLWLGLAVMALAFPNALLLAGMRPRLQRMAQTYQIRNARFASATTGIIQNIDTIKASGLEWQSFENWAGVHALMLNAQRELSRQSMVLSIVPTFLARLTTVAIVVLGAVQTMRGELSVGDFAAFQTLAMSFTGPIGGLVSLGTDLARLRATLLRIDDAMRNPVDPVWAANAPAAVRRVGGRVQLEGVGFSYAPLSPPILSEIALDIAPGSSVALVGGSGSGKSTLGRLICGLFAATEGTIEIGGQPLNEIERTARARSISYVDQDIFLFAGTVRENLTLWQPGIPDQVIVSALSDAAVLDDVLQRPGGLDAAVEEGGANFSGGQRQRLEIARALCQASDILVLDEATAALDPAIEAVVTDRIRRRGLTMVVIAHRLSTVRDCDQIIVLEQGRIVERGTHDELLLREGAYSDLIKAN